MSNETPADDHPRSQTDVTSPVDAAQSPVESNESPSEVLDKSPSEGKSSLLAKLRASRFLQPRWKLSLLGSIVLLALVGGIAWWTLSDHEATPPPPQEPTPAERFAKLFEELKKSEEPVARMDAFPIDDAMLQALTTLDRLTTIQVEIASVTPETIEKLSKMPKLEQLHLRKTPINDEMLRQLASSPTIWLLNLPDTVVTPPAIESLSNMVALRQLRLGAKEGDNRHARAVAKLARLRAVHLIEIGVTDEGLQALASMPQLESLYLDGSAVTDSGWSWLFQNHPELHVHIDQRHHDRDPQKH